MFPPSNGLFIFILLIAFFIIGDISELILSYFISPIYAFLLSFLFCILMSFHPIWLSVCVLYPVDKIVISSMHILSFVCICLSKYHPSIIFPILSAVIHLICLNWDIPLTHLPLQNILIHLYSLSSSQTLLWDTLIILSCWKSIYLQLLFLILSLFVIFFGSTKSHLSVTVFCFCLLTSIHSFCLPSIDLEFIIYSISFLILFQTTKLSWHLVVFSVVSLFQPSYSVIKQSVLFSMIFSVFISIGRSCFMEDRAAKTANVIILVSYVVLFGAFFTSLMNVTVLSYSDELLREVNQVIRFIANQNISYYVNHKTLCFDEEELYYYLLGLPYEYILLTPFERAMGCRDKIGFYERIGNSDSTYLSNVFTSTNHSFKVYHIV